MNKGRSPAVRHVSGTHRVDLDRLYDCINLDPLIQIKYVNQQNTAIGRYSLKRIIHRTQMDTTDTIGDHDSYHTFSMQYVSFFCSCEYFIVQHE